MKMERATKDTIDRSQNEVDREAARPVTEGRHQPERDGQGGSKASDRRTSSGSRSSTFDGIVAGENQRHENHDLHRRLFHCMLDAESQLLALQEIHGNVD